MAGLLCLCGVGMNNCTVPSDFIVELYSKEDLDKAIANKTELIDLQNEKSEFWYCQECKRITVIDRKTGKYVRSYFRTKQTPQVTICSVHDWSEIYFWSDKEFYDATEECWHVTVGEFIKSHPSRYLVRLADDLTVAHIFSPQSQEYLFSYCLDPTPDFVKKSYSEKHQQL